ncbi:MAG TPA: hypothetical protein VKX40_06615 [Aequorivita sp.]|nr:hypothetical protein [Aequorivita sp.]
MKKLVILIFLVFGGVALAQEGNKNLVYGQFSILGGDANDGGSFTGSGYSIGYSRYIWNHLYADFNIGAFHYKSKGGSHYFLEDEEESYWNMKHWSLGIGYDLVRERKLTVSGELALLNLSNVIVDEVWMTDGEITFRSTGRIRDKSLLVNIKGLYNFSDNWMGIATLGYGFGVQRYQSTQLKVGLGYRF